MRAWRCWHSMWWPALARAPVRGPAAKRLEATMQRLMAFAGCCGREVRAADRAGARKARLEPAPQALRLRPAPEVMQGDEHAAEIVIPRRRETRAEADQRL